MTSGNYGGIITFTMPIGGANAGICPEIRKAQVQALMSRVTSSQMEAAKTQADIRLVVSPVSGLGGEPSTLQRPNL